ncbi:MAG: hypothetical protein LC104_00990 [Bacteroidales bacterium]|nr:hypothetical protein [Bacteroidales bacterium]
MSDPFQVLNLPTDADDQAIRARYLELVRQFPPEQSPKEFAKFRAAYEKISTLDARAAYFLAGIGNDDSIDAIIEDLTCSTSRSRLKLNQLLEMALRK